MSAILKPVPKTSESVPNEPYQNQPVGKGRATPRRREKEEARKRPLVPNDRKAAARASRAQLAEARERARVGMANGEERFLPIRDRGPQKRYVRDYVDARWNVGELLLPLMVGVILTYFVPIPEVTIVSLVVVWAVMAVVIFDCVLLGVSLRKKLSAKFGADRLEKVRWYAAMRAVQLRPMRLPKPQTKRGDYPQ